MPAKPGTVHFDHGRHTGAIGAACETCHHPSRAEKPLATANQACRDCHAMPAAPPVRTSRQAAFHDPRAATGTCIGCHKEAVAAGRKAPLKCAECHKRAS
ncbi:MAG: cytochrome c family protein [Vicinamibacteria bacterium]|nr:cytochrome c family protein [Vicinamibacteria bacterium]